MPNDSTEHTGVIKDSVGRVSSLDPGSAAFRLAALALMLIFLTVLSYLSASNFDETEVKLIGGMAVITLLVLFAPDIARKYLPGGK